MNDDLNILQGDCQESLRTLADNSVDCCITSPPYFGLRDYGHDGQIGMEESPEIFVQRVADIFREVRRILKSGGTLWLNLGDSYNANGRVGHGTRTNYLQNTNRASLNRKDVCRASDAALKPKDLIGIPWRVAFALQADGWYLRQDIIWHKPNPMPESVSDRCTKSHEYIFLLSKSERYYFDSAAMQELAVKGAAGSEFNVGKTGDHQLGRSSNKPRKTDSANESHVPDANQHGGLHRKGCDREPTYRNKRSVWTVPTSPYSEAHFATFPPKLIEPCVIAGCPIGGVILDPFAGSGTTGQVALVNNRKSILCELNPEYVALIKKRLSNIQPNLI